MSLSIVWSKEIGEETTKLKIREFHFMNGCANRGNFRSRKKEGTCKNTVSLSDVVQNLYCVSHIGRRLKTMVVKAYNNKTLEVLKIKNYTNTQTYVDYEEMEVQKMLREEFVKYGIV